MDNSGIRKILAACDHTLLKQEATWEDVKKICEEGVKYETASVCISPCYVKQAAEYIDSLYRSAGTGNGSRKAAGTGRDERSGKRCAVCTVIGFPNGTQTTAAKVFETRDAVANGADEIDMVISIGALKAGDLKYVADEIRSVKEACGGRILKVIIETCLLTKAEKIAMCGIVTETGADYIKTSTGFSAGGATFEDVALFREHIGPDVKIKAAGGISSLEDAARFMELGADRLGTSRIVKIVKQSESAE